MEDAFGAEDQEHDDYEYYSLHAITATAEQQQQSPQQSDGDKE